MSYKIIYKVVAIPQGNGKYTFEHEAGSSNLYELYGSGRKRVRNWYPERMITKGEALTPNELGQKLCEFLQEKIKEYKESSDFWGREYNIQEFKQRFGYYTGIAIYGSHTTKTSWGRIRNLYINALKKAMANEKI